MREKPREDFYSVEEAAKLLGRTPERIRQMLHAGELEGEHEGDPHASWKVYKASVDARRDRSRG
jgi:excisionase family DNA binding protein